MFLPPARLDGIDIIVSPDPRYYYDLPADVPCTAEYRREFNEWSRRFFPPHPESNVVPDGKTYAIGRTAVMNERTLAALKAAVKGEA